MPRGRRGARRREGPGHVDTGDTGDVVDQLEEGGLDGVDDALDAVGSDFLFETAIEQISNSLSSSSGFDIDGYTGTISFDKTQDEGGSDCIIGTSVLDAFEFDEEPTAGHELQRRRRHLLTGRRTAQSADGGQQLGRAGQDDVEGRAAGGRLVLDLLRPHHHDAVELEALGVEAGQHDHAVLTRG